MDLEEVALDEELNMLRTAPSFYVLTSKVD